MPALEAEAVGTPLVANNATAVSELIGPFGIGCTPAMGMIGPDGTNCALPNISTLVEGLEMAYDEWKHKTVDRNILSRWAYDHYNWNNLYLNHWKPLLKEAIVPIVININDKLVLGCGMKPKDGAVNHDLARHHDFVDIAHDLNIFPYPWEDNSFDFIECEDVLEHLDCNIIDFMNECWRIIRPEGNMVLITVENGSWQHLTDPTHKRGFTLNSFDYFDDETVLGKEYGTSYTEKRWNILRKSTTPSGEFLFILSPIKREHNE